MGVLSLIITRLKSGKIVMEELLSRKYGNTRSSRMTLGIGPLEEVTEESRMTEDIKKLCKAVGMSVDMIARKYNVNQDMVLELFMQAIKKIQKKVKE